MGDRSARYYEHSQSCKSDYFSDTINPVTLDDCFLFPENGLFDVIKDSGYYTSYTNIFYWLTAKAGVDPFSSPNSGNVLGNYALLEQLMNDYYYIVYFTSKVVDRSTGEGKLQVNRFYSTESAFNSNQGGAQDLLVYHEKKYNLDISIMPWANNLTTTGLVWLGRHFSLNQLTETQVLSAGLEVDFTLYQYNIDAFRYYKKLDWLLGIIGGAMILFYILLWLPCIFINRTIHKMNNVRQLFLINHSKEDDEILKEEKVT